MTIETARLSGIQARLAFAGRRFHAWWEGYAFDAAAERAMVASEHTRHGAMGAEAFVAQQIWGDGRLEPGSPAWTMRFARLLSLPIKANVIVFGAGAGAPLMDLRHGTKWRLLGLTRGKSAGARDLRTYDEASQRVQKTRAAGAISFFELSADTDPAAFARLAGERLLPGAKSVFVDYTVARKGAKLRSCFPPSIRGAPRTVDEFERALQGGGFSVSSVVDETATYLPLVSEGWAGWRHVIDAIKQVDNHRQRARLLRALAQTAHIWAERFDAMKSGQLQVTRIQAVKD